MSKTVNVKKNHDSKLVLVRQLGVNMNSGLTQHSHYFLGCGGNGVPGT